MPFCPECGAEKFGDTCNKCSVSPTATIANKPESQERISQQGQITISSSPSDQIPSQTVSERLSEECDFRRCNASRSCDNRLFWE